MVSIIDYVQRTNSEGEKFFALIIQGGMEFVKSRETGRFYATAKKASITSTFTEEFCKSVLGKNIPGRVVRTECEPFEYTVQETGEIISLAHRWEYTPEEGSMEEAIFEGQAIGVEY